MKFQCALIEVEISIRNILIVVEISMYNTRIILLEVEILMHNMSMTLIGLKLLFVSQLEINVY